MRALWRDRPHGGAPVNAASTVHVESPRHAASTTNSGSSAKAVAPDTADRETLPAPLVWTFDGPFERCLADLDDTLRRALVMVGDAARLALLIDLSLPAIQKRVEAGDRLQPAWTLFLERIARYGLPAEPRVRHLRAAGPLATLVIAYRR